MKPVEFSEIQDLAAYELERLVVGDTPPVKAQFDTRQISTDRISSVQYIKFRLAPEQLQELAGDLA